LFTDKANTHVDSLVDLLEVYKSDPVTFVYVDASKESQLYA